MSSDFGEYSGVEQANIPASVLTGLERKARTQAVAVLWTERFLGLLVLGGCSAIIFYFFKPGLLLSHTTATGGDMGAHHYLPFYLKSYLLPHGKISGWSPDWYAGFPALTFYFPLPSLLIALLSGIMSYDVAFKLITVLGTILLPVGVYSAFKILDFEFPMPEFAALTTIPFLLMESFTINGGNILSTLAGEFSYSIAFALTVPALALLYKVTRDNRYIIPGAICLAVTALSHSVPLILVGISSISLVAGRTPVRRGARLAICFGLGFGLCAFWALPFLADMAYTAGMRWQQTSDIASLIPAELRTVAIAALAGFTAAIIKRESRLAPFATLGASSILLYLYLPDGPIWRGRFLPFWYLAVTLFAAYAFFSLAKVARTALATRSPALGVGGALIVLLATALTLDAPAVAKAKFASAWTRWNYTGYEDKLEWPLYNQVNAYLKSLPPGRVMWEYSPEYEKFGTPRAFEMIPYWTGQPTMEGTLIESSITAPFHFINQGEISLRPTHAIPSIRYPPFNFQRGIEHLKLFNIRYLMTSSREVSAFADSSKELRPLKRIDEFNIYEMRTDGYVTIPRYRPVRHDLGPAWRETSLAWYLGKNLDVPIVFGSDEALAAATVGKTGHGELPKIPLGARGKVTNVLVGNEDIRFDTSAIGVPHLVSISYFPNWRVEGADGPYLVTPSLMMVIPRGKTVHLYYGKSAADYLGIALTLGALAGCLIAVARKKRASGKRYAGSISCLPQKGSVKALILPPSGYPSKHTYRIIDGDHGAEP